MIGIFCCCCCYTGISSFIQCYYYTHTKDSCGKECAKVGIRKRSEIAIFKTIGFEQVPII
jgi:hypothetical protein